jgi:hypothetical protein
VKRAGRRCRCRAQKERGGDRTCCCCCCCRHALRSYWKYRVLTSSVLISPFPLHPARVLSHLHTSSLISPRLDSTPPYLEGAVVMATRHYAYRLCCVRAVRASMPAVSACVPTVHARARCSASAPVVSCDALVVVLLLVSLLTCC